MVLLVGKEEARPLSSRLIGRSSPDSRVASMDRPPAISVSCSGAIRGPLVSVPSSKSGRDVSASIAACSAKAASEVGTGFCKSDVKFPSLGVNESIRSTHGYSEQLVSSHLGVSIVC